MNLLLVERITRPADKDNPIVESLFTKKYKLKIVDSEEGEGSIIRKKN